MKKAMKKEKESMRKGMEKKKEKDGYKKAMKKKGC